jgi:hypothetical protein
MVGEVFHRLSMTDQLLNLPAVKTWNQAGELWESARHNSNKCSKHETSNSSMHKKRNVASVNLIE